VRYSSSCRSGGRGKTPINGRHARLDRVEEVIPVATATMFSAVTQQTSSIGATGDFVQDVSAMAERLDVRLRMSLTPQQYAMVQDLVLATRITTIARDADDELAESNAA
jgi:hypothetical protein